MVYPLRAVPRKENDSWPAVRDALSTRNGVVPGEPPTEELSRQLEARPGPIAGSKISREGPPPSAARGHGSLVPYVKSTTISFELFTRVILSPALSSLPPNSPAMR